MTGMLNCAIGQLPGFTTFTIQDGLAGNLVRRIIQDRKGFIWIATWEGVSKYDGHRFTNFTKADGLSFDLVNDLHEESDGKLLVALNNRSTQIISNDKVQPLEVLKNITIEKFVTTGNGEMIVLTSDRGIMKVRKGSLYPLSISLNLSDGSILQVADSLFLLSSPDKKNLHLLNSKFEVIQNYPAPVSVYSLVKDSENRVWAGCMDGLKQVIVDSVKYHIRLEPPPALFQSSLLKNGHITCTLEDDYKNLWIGTRKGIVLLEENGAVREFSKKDGLPDDHIYCLFQDREKNIWIGTAQGVARIGNKGRIKHWATGKGPFNDHVDAIIKTGKTYLVGGESGIQKIGPASDVITSLADLPKGYLRLQKYRDASISLTHSNRTYVSSVDLKNNRLKDSFNFEIPPGRNFYCMAVSNKGTIIVGTTDGLVSYYKGRIRADTSISGLITCLLIDDSILWAGTHSKGLQRIRFEEKEEVKFSGHTLFTAMPDSMIRSIYKDSKGILWVGTRLNGVYKISWKSNQEFDVERFDKRRGLISDWVRCITEDKKHNIWIGTHSGVDKLVEGKKGWRIFNFSRFINLSGVVNTILADDDAGRIWVGMNNGLASVPDAGLDTLSPLPVYITRIQTGSGRNSIFVPADHPELSLLYSSNAISFDFTSTGFFNEKEMRYGYRLLGGSDTLWNVAGSEQRVSYASLQPGNYRFEVRSLGWNGEWGIPAKYSFTISPPFWKTWWFVVSLFIAFGLLFYLLYRYRVRQLNKLQQVRNRIATDLHDHIGSSLTNISILTELSKRNSQVPDKAEAYLDRIREEIDASGQALDDIIWSVNTKNDTLHEISARIRRYAAELFDARNIRYELQMDPQIATKKIMMEQRRDLWLIFKEALNNIQKHAAASFVSIALFLENENVRMIIKDDGRGFDTSRPTERNGINNIKERVKRWKGSVDIRSGNGLGTTILIGMPLTHIMQKGD